MSVEPITSETRLKVNVEYWYVKYVTVGPMYRNSPYHTLCGKEPNRKMTYTRGACDYGGHCLALAQTIRKSTPDATVSCKRGRQGSFEIAVNDKLIYSKLQTMALPNYDEVAQVVNDVSQGAEPHFIKGQQPIDCVIS